MTESELILAIDAGTSSTRVLAFDFAGKTVGPIAQRTYAQTTTPDGGVFTDADALLELTAQCLDETLQSVKSAPIAALAMSCFWHSLLGVGEDGKPRTPLFSWADNRAAPFVKTLREKLDEDAAHARTGCLFHASFWPAKLLWLRETQPELFDGKTRWMSFGEYLALQWCGAARVSLSMASGTGLFNQNACDWDDETLSVLPISRAALSPLCDAADALNAPLKSAASTRTAQTIGAPAAENANARNTMIATAANASTRKAQGAAPENRDATKNLNAHNAIIATEADVDTDAAQHIASAHRTAPQTSNVRNAIIATTADASTRSETLNPQLSTSSAVAAARWPQLQNAKWFPALGDGACSNIGSGCANAPDGEKRGDEKTRIALNVGTSGALRVVLRDFSGAPPRGLFRYRLDAKRSVLGGALSNGGNVLMWARANLALPDDAEALISAMAPDAHGLTILPFLAGERSPSWNDAARFALNGATLDTTPAETYRAVLEGASLRFLRVLQLLQTALQAESAASTRASAAPDEMIADDAGSKIPDVSRIAAEHAARKVASTRETNDAAATEKIVSSGGENTRETSAQIVNILGADTTNEAVKSAASTRSESDCEIVASGGALSHSATWAQIMADCLGAPLIESKENQASARGAALMALEALGIIKNVSELPAERGEVLAPEAAHHALYVKALARQSALYTKLFGAT